MDLLQYVANETLIPWQMLDLKQMSTVEIVFTKFQRQKNTPK